MRLVNARLLDPATGSFLPQTSLTITDGVIGDPDDSTGPVLDLRGAVVTPGLVDGHMHPVSGASLTRGVDLSGCSDLASVRAALAAARPAPGVWLHGWGLDPNAFGGLPISADTVGPVLDGVPAALQLFDGHSMLASHTALALAGVDGPRRFADTSQVVCGPDGKPTGLLLEDSAVRLVEDAAPPLTTAALRELVADTLRGMAAAGLTGGYMMEGDPAQLDILRSLDESGELPLRLRVAPWCRPYSDISDLVVAQGDGGRYWQVDGVKLFLDGTIDNGTAWLEHPDLLGESTRALWPDPALYTKAIATLHAAGIPTATHAIGDAAVRHVLDAISSAGPGRARPISSAGPGRVRHRIEHVETVPDETVRRFAELGVVASMQPTHCTEFTRADHTDNWSHRLGPGRAAHAWRCNDLWDAGATVVLGSDWPIAPYPPLAVMAGARHRRPSRDLSSPPHGPTQALTPLRALQGMTLTHTTSPVRLRPGHRADLTVFAESPLDVPDTSLAGLPILATIMDGRLIYRDASL